MAGLIKAALALHTQILPPTTGCEKPHPELTGTAPALRIHDRGLRRRSARAWTGHRPPCLLPIFALPILTAGIAVMAGRMALGGSTAGTPRPLAAAAPPRPSPIFCAALCSIPT